MITIYYCHIVNKENLSHLIMHLKSASDVSFSCWCKPSEIHKESYMMLYFLQQFLFPDLTIFWVRPLTVLNDTKFKREQLQFPKYPLIHCFKEITSKLLRSWQEKSKLSWQHGLKKSFLAVCIDHLHAISLFTKCC